jgi:N-acetylglucosamine kinase-like BadF-type ATPase
VVIPDLAVAFAAATEAPDGTVLIAGTGAVSALVRDRRAVRRCDGYGWLVGDEGSGVWIGQQAVRAVLGALDGRREPTLLVDDLPEALLGADCDRAAIVAQGREALAQAVIAAVYDAEPARLAVLAPVVERAASQGDVTARRIIGEAARSLVCSARALGQDHPAEPFVLSGSLLTGPTLLAELVRTGLTERREAPVLTALDGASGAAALALRAAAPRLNAREDALRRAHRRLISTAPGRAAVDVRPRSASTASAFPAAASASPRRMP